MEPLIPEGQAVVEGPPPLDPNAPPPAPAPKRLGDMLDAAMERMQRRADEQEKPIPLPWKSMAEQLCGGLWPGLHVLVGGTGTGKSQWALQAALHAAKAGTPVLYVGLELGDVDLVARLLGEEAHKPWSDLFLGKNGALHSARVAGAHEALRNLPFHMEFGRPQGWPASRLREAAEQVRAMYPQGERGEQPFLVVLDFLQIVGDEPDAHRSMELRQRIGQAAYAARDIARNMDAAVLLVSGTSRANYGAVAGKETPWAFHDDHRIIGVDALVGLGKESGEIEYAADSVTVAVRWPEELPEKMPNEGRTSVIFATAKVRAGKPRWSELRFNGWRFSEAEGGDQALVAAMAQARSEPDTDKREQNREKEQRQDREKLATLKADVQTAQRLLDNASDKDRPKHQVALDRARAALEKAAGRIAARDQARSLPTTTQSWDVGD